MAQFLSIKLVMFRSITLECLKQILSPRLWKLVGKQANLSLKKNATIKKKRRDATNFNICDLVRVLITSYANTGESKKLLPKFKGPFRVVNVLYNDRYEIEDLREGQRKSNIRMVVAADKIKKWIAMMNM